MMCCRVRVQHLLVLCKNVCWFLEQEHTMQAHQQYLRFGALHQHTFDMISGFLSMTVVCIHSCNKKCMGAYDIVVA